MTIAPDYRHDIDLTFDLDAENVVTAISQAVRHGAPDAPLRLDGEDLTLVSIHVQRCAVDSICCAEEGALIALSDLPERFTLRIVNEISLAANTVLGRIVPVRRCALYPV